MIPTQLGLVVEDPLSEAVLRRIVETCASSAVVHESVFQGKGFGGIRKSLRKFVDASKWLPHVILTDLDRHACPPALLEEWGVPKDRPGLLFRVAVREVEAWILADHVALSDAFALRSATSIPDQPELLRDPKRALLDVLSRSRRRSLVDGIHPEDGAAATVGPNYNFRLCTFARARWDPTRAAVRAPSLGRAMARLEQACSAHRITGGPPRS